MKLPLALIAAFTSAAFGAVLAPALPDAAPAPKPGLTLTFSTPDGKTDTRTARLLALFVPAEPSPTPFLPEGIFTAKRESEIAQPAADLALYFATLGTPAEGQPPTSLKARPPRNS